MSDFDALIFLVYIVFPTWAFVTLKFGIWNEDPEE